MANQTITFNQPGIKIFMTDDYSFLDGMNSNTLTVDIRNTGENYIVLPNMYRVTDKNGNHPSGNTVNGTYFTQSQANAARSAMINSVYNGVEYSSVQDNYRSILRSENSHIWDDLGKDPENQAIIYYYAGKGEYVMTKSPDFNSTDLNWPSSINSDGFWFTGYNENSNSYICQKVNDWSTYAYDYYNFMYSEFYWGGYSISDVLDSMMYGNLGLSNLYTIMSNWGLSSTDKPMLGLAYIGYGQTETENVQTTIVYSDSDISSSGIRFSNIQFRYNGAEPSQIFYSQNFQSEDIESVGDWKVIKVIANARTDQGSGNTESIIIIEKLQ